MKINYSLCAVLKPFTAKGEKVDADYSWMMSERYESIEELVEETPMLTFVTDEDIKYLENEVVKLFDNFDSCEPEVVIWSNKDGWALYSPKEIDLQGVERLLIYLWFQIED